jgi:hypothetical protein
MSSVGAHGCSADGSILHPEYIDELGAPCHRLLSLQGSSYNSTTDGVSCPSRTHYDARTDACTQVCVKSGMHESSKLLEYSLAPFHGCGLTSQYSHGI